MPIINCLFMRNSCLSCVFKTSKLSTEISITLLLLRVVIGLAFLMHGWGKIQSPFDWMGPDAVIPGFFQFLAAFSEFGGGIALIFGLLTRLAGLGMAFTMLVAVYFHMIMFGDPFVATGAGQGSYELAAVYLMIFLLIISTGPGKFSLDKLIFGEISKSK